MRHYLKLLVVLFLGISTQGTAQSLEGYLKEAAENNPLLKAKYAEFQAAVQKVAQVNSLPNPSISFGYFISPIETRVGAQRAKIGISQSIPWFGTLKTTGSVYNLKAEAKYQEFIDARNELFMKVKSAWYPLFEVNREILLQKENREILGSYKQLATTGFKVGKNSMADVVRVDIMIENTDTEIKLLEDKIKPLTIYFNKLLNQEDTYAISIADSIELVDIPLNYRRDSLLINNPMLQSLDLKYKSAQTSEALAKKEGLPSIGIGLDYVFVDKRTDMDIVDNGKNAIMPMISVTLPIYRKKYKAAEREAQLNQDAISFYRDDLENTLISNYEMTWYELERAKEQLLLYTKQIEKTLVVIQLLEKEYSTSGEDFVEILRMQQELINYQIAAAKSIKNYFIALAKLDYLTAKSE